MNRPFDLRDYQTDLVDRAWAGLQQAGARILTQLPTGGGKSACQAELVRRARALGWQVAIAVHRRELVHQLAETVERHVGIAPELVTAGSRPDWSAPIIVGMNQTLVRRADRIPPGLGLLLQDEAHHGTSTTYRALYAALPAGCRLSGWTATPERLDGKPLGDVFDRLECGPSTRWLIDEGYLSSFRYLSAPLMSVTGVRRVAGDFNAGDLARANNPVLLAAGVVESYQQHIPGRRTVVFAVNITHSRQIAYSLAEAGIPALHVDGSTPPEERAKAIADFRAGRVQVLCSCDLFCEGLDIPGIEAGILARPTASLTIHLQQIGRTLRPAPGKAEAVIIDVAGNWERHGLPDDDRLWSLEGRPPGRPRRLTVNERAEVVDVPPREILEGDAQLVEIHHHQQAEPFRWARLLEEQQAGGHGDYWLWHQLRENPDATLSAWRNLARILGRRRGWAMHQYRCWTLRENGNGYPEQRAHWEAQQQRRQQRAVVPTPMVDVPIIEAPTPAAAPSSPPPAVSPALATTWAQMLERMGSMRGTQMLLTQQGHLEALDGHRAVVRVPRRWLGTVALRQEAIAATLATVLGHPVELTLAPTEDVSA